MQWLEDVKAWLMVAGFRMEQYANTAFDYVSAYASRHPTLFAVLVLICVYPCLSVAFILSQHNKNRTEDRDRRR
jgi:hypothetical protein